MTASRSPRRERPWKAPRPHPSPGRTPRRWPRTRPRRARRPPRATPPQRPQAKPGLSPRHRTGSGSPCLVPPDAITTAIAKADGDEKAPMQAVFDQDGDLIGVVDPAAIQPVAGTGKKADTEPEAEPAPDGDDMTPAPAAETGTPADAVADDGTVAKQDQDADVYAVLKSAIAEAVAGAIGSVQPAEDVAKQADVAAL